MNPYSQEHTRLLKCFTDHGVKFILIGGHAAIYHGVRRNTGDLDILVEPTSENGALVIKALESIQLELPPIDPSEFEKPMVLTFGLEPDAVDILNFTPGVEFQSAFQNSKRSNFNGVSIQIMSIDDLIKNKQNLHRTGEKSHLDQYDMEVLKKILRDKNEP